MSTFHAAAKWFEQVGRYPNFQMIPTGSHLAGQCRLGLAFGGYRQGRLALAVIWLPRQSVSAFHTAVQKDSSSPGSTLGVVESSPLHSHRLSLPRDYGGWATSGS